MKQNPPLLHTYTAPSGPTAAPLGLPPSSATTSTVPSSATRTRRPLRSSTQRTLPSGRATGPSGNPSPDATTCAFAKPTPPFLAGRTGQRLLELLRRHEHVARLGPGRGADDAALLEQVHQPPGPGEAHPQLALQHRG